MQKQITAKNIHSIRKSSVSENIKINLIAIYYILLLYESLINNTSRNKSFKQYNKYISNGNASKNNIGKLFYNIRNSKKK